MRKMAFLSLLIAPLSFAKIQGQSQFGLVEWQGVSCAMNQKGLTIRYDRSLEINLPNFQSLTENPELVVNITSPSVGTARFQDHRLWVVDSGRVPESTCKLQFSELTPKPLAFKVAVTCTDLPPADPLDGGVNDISAEPTPEKIICQ